MEAGVAHRSLAFMSFLAGDFLGAQVHCEHALAACSPERDQEARERTGEDTGPVATSMLALTSWVLGRIDRARELIEAANRRAAEINHISSMVIPLYLKCLGNHARRRFGCFDRIRGLGRSESRTRDGAPARPGRIGLELGARPSR